MFPHPPPHAPVGRARRSGGRRLLLLISAVALACAPGPGGETTPLLDGVHAPLVLTESAVLDKPPAWSGNRFVAGWWPGSRGRSPSQLNVGDRAVLEAVFLDSRERRIATRLEILEAEPGATFGVRVAGIELPPQPLRTDPEVPLPAELPLGRQPIELDLRGSRVRVHAVGFGHAWRAGEVEMTTGAIVQGAYSAIDFPRRLAKGATLVGSFEPPSEPEADQRFAVLVETDAGEVETAFEWRPGRRGARRLRHGLPAGFVRIRLLAQGLGPAGHWRDLAVAGGDPGTGRVSLTTVPGRDGTAYAAASDRYKLIRAPGLGLHHDVSSSRDAEYVFDLRRDPEERRNLAGARAIEIDWLRSRLEAWIEGGATP